MGDTSVTASGIISFAEKLEDKSAAFYRQLAERFPSGEEIFLALASKGEKNKILVVRTYRETISDALEAAFSFRGVDLADYAFETALIEGTSYTAALEMALALEEQAITFYEEMADRSESLMATVPMAFRRAAKTRKKHQRRLQSLLDEM